MKANRRQLALGVGILLWSTFESLRAYPLLPDSVASNFGGDGAPGAWSSKEAFFGVTAVSLGFWFGALLVTPALAARTRRQGFTDEETLWLRDFIGWFLLASVAFSAAVLHLVLEANLTTGRLSGAFVWILAVYMAYMVWWTVTLVKRSRAAKARSAS